MRKKKKKSVSVETKGASFEKLRVWSRLPRNMRCETQVSADRCLESLPRFAWQGASMEGC